jgi:hypothetical protein
MRRRFSLSSESQVIEIAANDGYLLQYVQQAGIPCLGIEPTHSTAAAAKKRGLSIIERFFGTALAQELCATHQQADLIAANNVLAHVPDINDFVGGFTTLLKPHGVATFEFPHLLQMVAQHQFDTAYHEHYSYLSLTVVEALFRRNGLQVFDVEALATHGGSLRVYAQKAQTGPHSVTPAVSALLTDEATAGMTDQAYYRGFQAQAENVKNDLLCWLIDCKRKGIKVGAYGAAAKGNTLLNFAGVKADLLPYVVDRSPGKAGRYLPGSRIPVVDESFLQHDRPDRVLILPWNLKPELSEQLSYVQEWGAQFVTAVPRLSVTPARG